MDPPISTPREGSRPVRCFRALMRKSEGLVPGGASSSRQQNDVVIEMPGGISTSSQHVPEILMRMDAEASTSRQHNDAVGEIEEETDRIADRGTEEHETAEDMRDRSEWVTSIRAKIVETTPALTAEAETISIARVPQDLRGFYQRIDKPYEPRVISIGPYHWGKPHLNNMQKLKWQRLKSTYDQQTVQTEPIFDLNVYFKKLKGLEEQARRFYPESEQQHNRGEFLEMLLLDGCFIVDYLVHASSDESKTEIWRDLHIRNDLLLLENQLPFFVVECIYGLVKGTENKTLVETAVKFFHNISPKDTETGVHEPEKRNIKHLLHLYHAYLFFDEHDGWKENEASQVLAIPSAIFLDEAGIKFKKRKTIDKAMEVKFIDGVMNITPLVINTFTVSQFLNLIEFERAHPHMEPRFTAFAQFMEYIVSTSEDVALLRKKGILEHAFGSDKEVARIFSQLIGGTFHYLPWEMRKVYKETDRHCKVRWNRWRATFWRDYCSSPWAAMSILAGVLLVSFAFIQIVFTMYNRFRPVFPPPPSS